MEMTVKPNFFIVGAPKCGTTAMYEYLSPHPDIFMPETVKEPHYFAPEYQLQLATRYSNLDTYLNLFADARTEKRIGEASVFYLCAPEAAHKIWEFDPHARIIIMLRNPVDMMYSLFYQERFAGNERLETFEAALAAEADRKQGIGVSPRSTPQKLFYRDIGRFSEQVQRYFDCFGRENVHVIIYDDLRKDVGEVYRQTLQFLDVDPDFQADFKVHNPNQEPRVQTVNRLIRQPPKAVAGLHAALRRVTPPAARNFIWSTIKSLNTRVKPRPPMRPETRQQLLAEFRPEVDRLSELLGRDLNSWYQ
jgi:hypothetical protein